MVRGAALPSPRSRHREGRVWREAFEEALSVRAPYTWYPQRAGRVDLLVPQLRAAGRADDPLLRQQVVRALALARTMRWTAERAAANRKAGRPPGPEGSLGKLASSNVARAASAAHAAIAGAAAMLSGHDSPLDGVVAEILVSVPAVSIAGGTDEIQHNILAERVLGLPKDPTIDASIPFRDVLTNPARRPSENRS
jgi:alkylation response protein AidB-like acyl-CoA dehydrogenase